METIEIAPKRYACRHIHTTGNRCGSPALKSEEFCYYHHATRRGPRPIDHDYIFPDSTFDLPSFEDRPSIQLAIAVVARRIALNQIDLKRARLLLYALRIASTNLPREPRTAERAEEIEQVEAVQHDPIHGPLAPVAEVVPKEERKGFAQRLLEELRAREPAKPEPKEETPDPPIEAIIPELQAVAAQHGVPHVRRGFTATDVGLLPSPPSHNTKEQTTSEMSRLEKDKKPCRRTGPSGSFDSALRATLRMTLKNQPRQSQPN